MMFVCNCLNLVKMPNNSLGPYLLRVRAIPRRNVRKQPVCTRGDGVCAPSVDTFVRTLTFAIVMLQSLRNPHFESTRNSRASTASVRT